VTTAGREDRTNKQGRASTVESNETSSTSLFGTLLTHPLVVKIAENFDYLRSIEKSIVIEYLGEESGEWALDVACGLGIFTRVLRGSFPRVVGLDTSATRIQLAHRVYPECDYVVGDAHQLPFRNGCFGTVICICSLEHMEDPVVALREIGNALRESGLTILTVDSWEMNVIKIPRFLLKTEIRTMLGDRNESELDRCIQRYHETEFWVKRRYSREQLATDLAIAGLRMEDYHYLLSGLAVPIELSVRGLSHSGVLSYLLYPLWLILIRSRRNKRSGYVLAAKARKS
jgi:ubiquinone/menaquinone biosynthesis C-methylase UbiE